MFRILDRYLIRQMLAPFVIVLVVFTFMLQMNPIMDVADRLIAKGVPWMILLRVLPLLLPQALALTIPMALLVSLLVALGRVSEDREWIALQACGVGVVRLLRPVVLLSIACFLVTMAVMVWALPYANQAYVEIMYGVVASRAQNEVRPRQFFQDFPATTIYVRDLLADGDWKDVFLADTSRGDIYLARRGHVAVDRTRHTVEIVLENGTHHAMAGENYRIARFDRQVMELDPGSVFPKPAKGTTEMTIRELQARVKELRRAGFPPVEETMALQMKGSIPAACLVFGLIGLGLGVTNRKSGKMASFVLGIGVIFAYYVIMYTCRAGARALVIPAWMAMWVPNFVLGPLGAALVVWRNRSTGRLQLPIIGWSRLASIFTGRRGTRRSAWLSAWVPRARILDRYVSRLFLRLFALTAGGLLVLFYISDFVDLSERLFRGNPKPATVVLYFLYKAPDFVYFIIPLGCLIATLVTVGLLTRNSELVVMKACGISLYRAMVPLLTFALLASGALFVLEEKVLAVSSQRASELRLELRGERQPHMLGPTRGWVAARSGSAIYHYQSLSVPSTGQDAARDATLFGLSVYTFNPASWRLTSAWYCSRARYLRAPGPDGETGGWTARNGWMRRVLPDGSQQYAAFEATPISLEPPEYFGTEMPQTESMTYPELKRYIDEMRAAGYNVLAQSVALDRKIAFPFVAFVMALIAVPFAVSSGRQGALYGIGVGVALAVVYWTTSVLFVAIGKGGLLTPVLAAWAPNIIFGAGAVYLLLTVRT